MREALNDPVWADSPMQEVFARIDNPPDYELYDLEGGLPDLPSRQFQSSANQSQLSISAASEKYLKYKEFGHLKSNGEVRSRIITYGDSSAKDINDVGKRKYIEDWNE